MSISKTVLLSAVVFAAAAAYAEVPEGYTTVDVMIVYTPAALDYVGGEANMNDLITNTVQQANEVHQNSDTQVYLNLVHTAETDYTEVAYDTDLQNLTYQNDGFMDEVHTLRDEHNADFVCLFEVLERVTGVGWQLDDPAGNPDDAFSTVSLYYEPIDNYTFVRNLALNMGCGYSKTQTYQPPQLPGIFSCSHGWQWDDSQSLYDGYCTVMTMADFDNNGIDFEYQNVPHFSNPDISYAGATNSPTGDSADGDNARTIRELRTVFEGYRGSGGEPPPPPPPATSNYTYYAGFETDFDGWTGSAAWKRQTGETPNNNTGPQPGAAEGDWYVYADSVEYGGQTVSLWQTFDFTSVTKLELGFWRHMSGKNMGTLSVGVSTNNGAQWDELWSQSGDQNLSWRWINRPLTAYEGQSNVTIRFSGLMGARTSDMALDGIIVTGVVAAAQSNNDQDGDGLPDDWEFQYFGGETNANPAATAANGANTVIETYIAGLDPTDPAALFASSMANAAGFMLQWNVVSGRVYSIWQSDSLHHGFQPLVTNIIWPQSNYIDTVSFTQRFYRIGVQLAE